MGCSEGLDAFRFFFKHFAPQTFVITKAVSDSGKVETDLEIDEVAAALGSQIPMSKLRPSPLTAYGK